MYKNLSYNTIFIKKFPSCDTIFIKFKTIIYKMSFFTVLTILFILMMGSFVALLLSYVIVPKGFRSYNNYRMPKTYKRRSRHR